MPVLLLIVQRFAFCDVAEYECQIPKYSPGLRTAGGRVGKARKRRVAPNWKVNGPPDPHFPDHPATPFKREAIGTGLVPWAS